MKLSKLTFAVVCASASINCVQADELDSIVVSANNTSQSLSTVTSSLTVIDREEILQKGYQSLTDALRTQPGISIKTSGGLGKSRSIFIRGASSSANQVLILIDGMEQTDPAGIGTNVANIQLDNVERIEILKGPQSGVWGANASGGVINIITLKGQSRANFNIERGADNFLKLATNLGAANDKVDFAIDFASVDTDGFSSVRPLNKTADNFEDDGFKQQDISFKLGINLSESSRIQASVKNLSADNDYDGTSAPDAEFTNTLDIETKQLQYLYNHNAINAKIFLQTQETKAAYLSAFGLYQSEGLIEHLGAQLGYQYGKDNQANITLEKKHSKNVLADLNYYNTGVALTNTHKITPSLVVNEVIRFDEYSDFKNATTGRLGLKNHFSNDIYLAANIGKGYNVPSLFQLSANNPQELEAESVMGHGITIGAYGAELTYFKSQTENLLESAGSWPNSYYINSKGKTKKEGWEFSYKQSIEAIDTDFTLNASWITALNNNDELKEYIPQSQASLTFDNYAFAKWHWGASINYTGENYPAADKQGKQIGDYFITNLFADYQLNKQLNVYMKVQNLQNRDYINSVADFPASNPEPNYVYETAGRQFFIGLRAQL